MKRHLPRVLSSFRTSKRRNAAILPASSATASTSSMAYEPIKRSKSEESIEHWSNNEPGSVPLAKDEVFEENIVNIRRHDTDPTKSSNHFWDFNKRFSTSYASFRAKKASNAKVSDMRQIEVLHEFQNNLTSPESPTKTLSRKSDRESINSESDKDGRSRKSLSFEDMENSKLEDLSSSAIALQLRTSSLAGTDAGTSEIINETNSKDTMSTSTNKIDYIIEELLSTEQSYVRELESVVEYYVKPFEAIENAHLIPTNLRGQSELIFGNLRELVNFHRHYVLADLQQSIDSVTTICELMIQKRNLFLTLYRPYCQNKPLSEAGVGDLQADQAGHLLPLSAYLLKPVQRITKYQLLLKEMLRCCANNLQQKLLVEKALASTLDLLAQLNAEMQQLHILGFAGDLRLLGPLRLQTECDVYSFKRKSRRVANKPQKRYLFLFDGGVLFCKKRIHQTSNPQFSSEYYEHKLCIPMSSLGFSENSKTSERFELWDESRNDGFAIQTIDTDISIREKWTQKLAKLTFLYAQQQSQIERCQLNNHGQQQQTQHQRPQSWTSESSTVSSSRSSTSALEDTLVNTTSMNINRATGQFPLIENHETDSNGNLSPETLTPSTSVSSSSLREHSNRQFTTHDPENNYTASTQISQNITNIQIPSSKSLQNANHKLELKLTKNSTFNHSKKHIHPHLNNSSSASSSFELAAK